MRPTLIVNPPTDEVFSRYAETLVDHGAVSTSELERRLRGMYPNAAVHAREIAQEPLVIWYVYREGRWVAPPVAERQGELDGERQG
ncbi:MAG TPA: hypothetical protein VLA44_06605 [Clostridia bacterium]|nr:hypothetical protein [Clostridia bacterium]